MLPVGWLLLAVVAAVLLSMWVTFTLTRLDRLHARVDAARAALDAQLVRRAAALQHVAEAPETGIDAAGRARYAEIAQAALTTTGPEGREAVENAVGRAVRDVAGGSVAIEQEPAAELREAAARVQVSRRFYNDAVRDTRTLRARRMPRLLRLAGRAELPQFFDIDDTLPSDGAAHAPRMARSAGEPEGRKHDPPPTKDAP
jgi:hypothetical protein